MTAVPEAERAVGIEVYASSGAPCGARAKSTDEDFRVEEAISEPGMTVDARPDYYPLYRVEKHSIDTMHMERELSDALKSRLSYGGLKDKRAVAVQYVTPTSTRSERPESVVRERFTAQLVGYVPHPLTRGSVAVNRFEIVLRDCCEGMAGRLEEVFGLAEGRRLPNFYGLQRFGMGKAGTHLIGRAIVKGKFEEAVKLMLTVIRPTDEESAREATEAMLKGRYEESLLLLSPQQDVERVVARRLTKDPGDWVAALRAVPIRLRRLYTQAYQSFIFNRTLSLAMSRGLDIKKFERGDNWCEVSSAGLVAPVVHGVGEPASAGAVPMVQFAGYAYRNYGSRFDACVDEVMKQEGVAPRDFYVKDMQEVSAEGGFRRPHLAVRDASFRCQDGRADLKFTLAGGQYATVLLREIIKPSDPFQSGLA